MIDETIDFIPAKAAGDSVGLIVPTLGIICHPDWSRIGEIAPLSFRRGQGVSLSRMEPLFYGPEDRARSLLDGHISRSPVVIKQLKEREFQISAPSSKMRVSVNGLELLEPAVFSLDELGHDIIISLSDQVILSLFMRRIERSYEAEKNGLLGISAQLDAIWKSIKCVAPTDLPVLVTGSTGTGKELVARAVHALSGRSGQSMLSINMATVTGDLAVADLFGAVKGAFTGSVRDRMGLFEQANESTLFLDEIGNAAPHVQPMLLRTLEAGEIRRVGEARTRRTMARVVAATDQSLEGVSFNQPLLRRLEAMKIQMPDLSERRVDIGLLVKHFLKTSRSVGLGGAVPASISGRAIGKLALYAWPGNIRELRNVVHQLALGQEPAFLKAVIPFNVKRVADKYVRQRKTYRPADDVSDVEMLDALDESDWCIKSAATLLNISRTALYDLIEKSSHVRKENEISDREIKEHMTETVDDVGLLAKRLRVSKTALRNRIKRLSLQ